ncbi:MAG: C4-dicarboxylate transporter permease [Microvirga sp.]|jgi:TRAP-type C4-dicarboxylate transport system permease small subunit|nr:C4-dicarboxylate transporter permease [Microvirga sp.]
MSAAALRRLDDGIGRGEDLFLAASHGIIAALVIAAVFFRYVLNDPLTWTEETIVLLFTWMLFAGLASGFRTRMHIRIDALLLALRPSGRAPFGAIAVAATLATLLGLVWFGIEQSIVLASNETPMMRISAAWGVSALPVGAALACIHVVRHMIDSGLAETLWPADLVGSHEEDIA